MQLQPVKVDIDQGLRRVSTSSTYEAVTNYRVLSSYGSSALVECTPESGNIQLNVLCLFQLVI